MPYIRSISTTALLLAACIPAIGRAQTEGTPAIAREVFAREVQRNPLSTPPAVVEERVIVPGPAVRERILRERVPPVIERPVVVERPVVRERVVVGQTVSPARATAWWEPLVRGRFGYYDDSYFDDNWFYDYYEAVAPPARDGLVRYRTGWRYAPVAERGMFHW